MNKFLSVLYFFLLCVGVFLITITFIKKFESIETKTEQIVAEELLLIIELVESNDSCVKFLINQADNDIKFPCSSRYLLKEDVGDLKDKLKRLRIKGE